MINVGIYGASGYMGGETLRILSEHPEVNVIWATSRSGKDAEYFHRNLYQSGIRLIKPEQATPCDAVFVALPTGNAMNLAPGLLAQGSKMIDLGSDFRLKDREVWERVYGKPHEHWELAEAAVYGIPELHREEIRNARIVANPGCFSSAVILGLAPLLKAGWVDSDRIAVDGLSGTTGAGADLDITMHHPEIGNNLVPYNVVDHRHTYEMEQELGLLSNATVRIHFTPIYAPITRGILAICHCFPKQAISREDLLELYSAFYANQQFIQVFDMPKDTDAAWQFRPYPWVSAVSGSNYCQIGLDVDHKRNRIVLFSVLDSIGKGGAHAGVQNLNLMFGLDEHLGLERRGLHPY